LTVLSTALLTAPLWCPQPAFAAAGTVTLSDDDVLGGLSRCDGSFFESLRRHAAEFSSAPQFTKTSGLAYFKVQDRAAPERSVLKFAAPFKLHGFEVVGYFDEFMGVSADEAFVSWGFLLRAPLEDVVKGTENVVWDSVRLQRDGPVFARSELWDHAKQTEGWQKLNTPGGVEAQTGTVERVLLIESYEKDPSLTRFGCSLQGAVTPDLLQQVRPDVVAKAARPK
jgi:hypothetical protein